MTRERASNLLVLLAQLGEAYSRGIGWINHCPRCYGPARYDGGLWKCGEGPGYPKGCGWYGEPETFTTADALRQAREAIEFLLADTAPQEGGAA